ncbi:ferritin-like protein [Flavobacterium sp. LS1R47]|jgi:rubrerythrin|uniref:Ferritin-like protein n=1 Tax=Flavobacterium frigoritolerans TaxID=2987686 RepID=A0A9X3C997_9FLAO|nr:ferritin-like protein [Flavobacterium frigoritolerans]MCV9933949.1 ferritin-like protein [Flavobacterium frigoritolerans]
MIFLKTIKLETLADLKKALQTAIELEHSTIPPYLTANFTLFDTGNDQISNLIGSVVGEEMLHLSIACNILNAIGGKPVLNKPGFIPTYPGPLPGSVSEGLVVPLEKFSLKLIHDVFMAIEEPENPIHINNLAVSPGVITIGVFYTRIKEIISELEAAAKAEGKTIFVGNPKYQMTYEKFFDSTLLFPIIDEETAKRGIDIIIDQGEGTTTDPFITPIDDGNVQELAHYYRFEEIYRGKTIQVDPAGGYMFGEPKIPFNPKLVPNMWPNPKMNDYPKDSQAYVNSKFFNYNYTSLLNSLHETFNGEPEKINTAMGVMYSLRLYAIKLLAIPDPNHPGYVAGPSFEYVVGE